MSAPFRRLAPLALALLLLLPGARAEPDACAMPLAFEQKDGNAPGGRTPVHADGQALLFIERLNVNTDGTRRSYRVDDFWGEREALNNLCNAMSDACAGLDAEGLRQRRLLTEQAAAAGWPADRLRATRLAPSILPFRDGKPCPAVEGYLVSATALQRPGVADVCDPARYADALQVPALVLPKGPGAGKPSGFAARGAGIGDLVVALRLDRMEPVGAVVGDSGPSGELGEGSVALNGRLLGKTAEPVNYRELRGKPPFTGKGWTVPPTLVLVFPGSRDRTQPYLEPERIEAAARARFEAWGGLARAQACAQSLKR